MSRTHLIALQDRRTSRPDLPLILEIALVGNDDDGKVVLVLDLRVQHIALARFLQRQPISARPRTRRICWWNP